jgi:hypothetical protein
MFNDLIRKQEKHVSFDSPINFNNNNSTNINLSTTSSSTSSTPQQPYTNSSNDNFRKKKSICNQFRQTEIRDIQQNCTTNKTSNTQSTTSSYISDDCKVLYIETVIEVAKPVFYEHTTDTTSTINTEYHHHIPHNKINTQQSLTSNRNKYFMDRTNQNHGGDSSDDDLTNQHNIPVNGSTTMSRHQLDNDHSKQPFDSGIELDQTSSSSTIYNQHTSNDRLFPPSNRTFNESPQPSTLLRRIQKQTPIKNEKIPKYQHKLSSTPSISKQSDTYWNRFKQKWFCSLLIGLFILFACFIFYLFQLDTCSRSAIIQTVCQKIICIENEGIPTI